MNFTAPHETILKRVADSRELANDLDQEVYLVGSDLEIIPSSKYIRSLDNSIYHISFPSATAVVYCPHCHNRFRFRNG